MRGLSTGTLFEAPCARHHPLTQSSPPHAWGRGLLVCCESMTRIKSAIATTSAALLATTIRPRLLGATFLILLVVFSSRTAPANECVSNTDILQRIAAVEKDTDVNTRTLLAQQLFFVVKRQDSQIHRCEIVALTRMLGNKDDGVRMWAANSLGYIGPRAFTAIPALKSAYRLSECSVLEVNSSMAIEYALKNMNSKPPKRHCSESDFHR